ncbi:MAG: FliO/MopB family protein [Clostridia bacterium]
MQLALQVALASIAVIGLVYVTLRLLNTAMSGKLAGQHLRVMEAVSVGRRAHMALVRVQDRYLVLGVTESNITVLAEVDLDCEDVEKDRGGIPSGLSGILARWRREGGGTGS